MSDRLRSDYTRYMEEIEPSQEFLSQLTRTLEEERPRRRRTLWPRIVPVAACLALLGLILWFYPRQTDPAVTVPSDPISDYAGNAGDSQTLPFTHRDWRDDSLTAESAPMALAEKMTASLEYLCCNEENKFTDAERADEDTVRRVIKLLGDALSCGESPSGIPRYYMAVFSDGTVATFSVTDQGYIRISGDDGVYKKSEP